MFPSINAQGVGFRSPKDPVAEAFFTDPYGAIVLCIKEKHVRPNQEVHGSTTASQNDISPENIMFATTTPNAGQIYSRMTSLADTIEDPVSKTYHGKECMDDVELLVLVSGFLSVG